MDEEAMVTTEQIKEFGIVGAGGAGFPTYVKLGSEAEIFIVNAAECEPLLHKDKELLRLRSEVFFKGLLTCLELTRSRRCIIGLKAKYADLVAHLEESNPAPDRIEIMGLRDFYPVGDEITLIYETTGRIVAPRALPITQGVVVNNVETIYNIGLELPLVSKFITVGGDVRQPISVEVPIGSSFRDVIALAGPNLKSADLAHMEEEFSVIVGGPMMGKLATSLDEPVTKTTGGLLVFAKDHPLIRRFETAGDGKKVMRIGKSACDQCSLCTELCPRHLLGHPIEPHKAMRSLMFSSIEEACGTSLAPQAHTMACAECNLCSLISCPEGLYPTQVSVAAKKQAMAAKASFGEPIHDQAHPMIDYRRTPVKKIMARLALDHFQNKGELQGAQLHPDHLTIRTSQHIGAPAAPVVSVGDEVAQYQKIASVGDKLGAEIHSPVNGRVTAVSEREIVIAPFA